MRLSCGKGSHVYNSLYEDCAALLAIVAELERENAEIHLALKIWTELGMRK